MKSIVAICCVLGAAMNLCADVGRGNDGRLYTYYVDYQNHAMPGGANQAFVRNADGTTWQDFGDIDSPITFTPEAGVSARFYRIKTTVK